jgi:hypothetical protein
MAEKKKTTVAKSPDEARAQAAAAQAAAPKKITPKAPTAPKKTATPPKPAVTASSAARKKLRDELSIKMAADAARTMESISAVERGFADLQEGMGDAEAFAAAAEQADAEAQAAIAAAAAEAGEGARLAQLAGEQVKIQAGEFVPIDEIDKGMTAEEVNNILAEFYGKIQTDALAQKRKASESAYSLLYDEFSRMGLGSLVQPLQKFIQDGISDAEFTLRLRETDAYKKRFAANAQRIAKGLAALSEADYVDMEDRYQNVMRQYGLPESYYQRGDLGRQEGFEKLLAADVRDDELADRLNVAYNRVINAAPQIKESLKQFYPDITNGDILAYTLDPEKAILDIKRKVTAAEIGAGAAIAGLGTTRARAEELGAMGVTAAQAREGFQTIAGFLPRASQLGDIYAKQGMGPFTQTTAESEVFGTTGAAEAVQKRRKLTELEQAQFGGTSGIAQGALSRERAGQF